MTSKFHGLDSNFYTNSTTFTYTKEMNDLIQSVLHIGVVYFTYDVNFNDYSHIRLTTHPNWIKYYYTNQLYKKAVFEKDFSKFENGYVLWDWLTVYPIYTSANLFGINNGLTIVRKSEDSTRYYHFGFKETVKILDSNFSRRIEILEQFIHFFHFKARKIISMSEKDKFILPDISGNTPKTTQRGQLTDITEKINKYYGVTDGLYISSAEMRVIRELITGKTINMTADSLCVSHRTVETHIFNIKKRLSCHTLFELGAKLGDEKIIMGSLL